MMKSRLLVVLCASVITLAQASYVNAATILYEYTGSWSSSNGTDPQELNGASFDLAFTIDSNTAPTSSGAGFASYSGDLTLVVTGSPGDIDGTYTRSNHSISIDTDFNNYGYIKFGHVNSTVASPINNTGGFIFLPLPQITLGIIADTSLPVGDFTSDVVGVWVTGTSSGGSYTGSVTQLSGTVVPIPAAAWLFGSGLLGLVGIARRKKAA